MDIWQIDKLLLFLAFVVPGFISLKTYQLHFPGKERATSDQLIDAMAYSSINYAILILPIIHIENSKLKTCFPFFYYLFYLFVFLIAPILWAFFWKYLRTREFAQRNLPHPTIKPWDFVFSKRKPYWIKVILKDGSIIAGKYADKSFTSNAPTEEQIYLEETWILNENGGFKRKKNNSAGVIVLSSEISYIELRDFNN